MIEEQKDKNRMNVYKNRMGVEEKDTKENYSSSPKIYKKEKLSTIRPCSRITSRIR